ncbi:MAG TPA: glycosyl transferase family 2 [Prolixibacteraceae bacterium]|nr:glycosyl transferase family 2 [Prolixibacteraceae bacterium]
MTILAIFVIVFSLIQLLIAVVNLIFSQRLSRAGQFKSLISVLIPARNEEQNIGNLLNDLLMQEYINIEIIVFNDQSTDNTAAAVEEIAAKDTRVKLIHSAGLPTGWLGKNHGCHQLATQAKGLYLLFLDADVRISGNVIPKTIDFAEKHNLGLLSVFPRQLMKTTGEKMTVPVMNYILLTLLPLVLVRTTRFSSLAAANGQFMLFNTEIYKQTLPHEKMKADKVEDIKIARFYKSEGIKTACLSSKPDISCRMYSRFSEAVHGFSKNVGQFFGNSLLVASGFWLITSFGFLPVLIALPTAVFLAYLAVLLMIRVIVSAAGNQNVAENLLYFIPQQVALGLYIFKAIINRYQKSYEWKGRKIA